MKNLKKILSLVLALAMALSLMTVAFAKDTGDFADGDDVTYAEAVDVMATIGVFNGVGDGSNFDPNGNLTREQAAKIITYMVMGQTQADQLVATIAPFADVSADRWSAGAIAYCASEGIMNGTGSGKFNPTGELTGLQFAKMLLVALGYDADIEEMTGTAWGLSTSKLAYEVGLNDGLGDLSLTAVLTREQAAQMALTTMKTPLVRYPDKGSTISVNGAVVQFGAREAEYVTSEIAKEQTISDQRLSNTKYFTIEFGEKYCPKLVLKHDQDVFGRPDYTWSYDKKKINSYVDYTDFVGEFTAKVTGKDLFELITKNILDDGDVEVYIDGVTDKEIDSNIFTKGNIVKTNTDAVGATANGVLTQVFVDTSGDRNKITIAIINTYLAQASEDYNTKDEDIDFDVYGINDVSKDKKNPIYIKDTATAPLYEGMTVKNEDFDVSEMKEDDIVLVRVADGAVQEMMIPEVVADATITNFKLDKYVTADGTKYDHASTALYDVEVLAGYEQKNMKDVTYNVILDPYGYLIGLEQNKDADQYVFITGRQAGSNDLGNANADMRAIFLDGTVKVIEVNVKDSDITSDGAIANTWCTYTIDKNGIYTLDEVGDTIADKVKVAQSAQNVRTDGDDDADDELTIDKKHVSLDGGTNYTKVYGNDDTIYLGVSLSVIGNASSMAAQSTASGTTATVSSKTVKYYTSDNSAHTRAAVIDDVDSVTVGVKNVSLKALDTTKSRLGETEDLAMPLSEIYTLYNDKGYVIAAVVIGENDGVSSNYAYITGSDYSREGYDSTEDEWSWSLEAIVDGKKVELTEVGSNIKYLDNMSQGNWYEVKYDAKGNVRGYKTITWQAADTSATTTTPSKYIQEVVDVEPSVDAHDTVLMQADYSVTKGNLYYKPAGTLYTDKTQTEGFSVSPDVKTVVALSLLKKDGTVSPFDDVTDGYTGYKGLENAIRDLDDNFKGYLNVIFEDGVATVIILDDRTGTAVDTGEEEIKQPAGKYSSEVDAKITTGLDKLALDDTNNNKIDSDGKTLKLNTYGGGDMATQIKDALTALGYSDVTMEKTGTKYTIAAMKGGVKENLEFTVGTDNVNYWIVDINGTKQYIQNSTQPAAIAKGSSKGTGFAVSTDGGTTWAYDNAYGAQPTAITKDTIIKSGYVKVATPDLDALATNAKIAYAIDGVAVAKDTAKACAVAGDSKKITVIITFDGNGVKNNGGAGTLTLGSTTTGVDVAVTGTNTGTSGKTIAKTAANVATFGDADTQIFKGTDLKVTFTIDVAEADFAAAALTVAANQLAANA